MTTHDCSSWNTYRATLNDLSHEVDGVAYVGGRGQRLDGILQTSYVDEAHQLGNDLAECLAALPPALAEQVLDEMKGALAGAAGQRHDLRSALVPVGDHGPEPVVPYMGEGVPVPPPDPSTLPVPVLEPEPRPRRRRHHDAAAALDEHRADPDAGAVTDVPMEGSGGG